MNSTKISLIEANQIIGDYLKKNISVDLSEAIDELNANEDIAESILVVNGLVRVAKLEIGASNLIVNGDLEVDETIQDCIGVDSSLLIVLGNVICKNLITLSGIHIAGNLNVANVILGDSLCNHSLIVGGDIECPTILDYGHDIRASGQIKTKDIHVFNNVSDSSGSLNGNLEPMDMVQEITKSDYGEILPDLSKTIKYAKSGGKSFRRA